MKHSSLHSNRTIAAILVALFSLSVLHAQTCYYSKPSGSLFRSFQKDNSGSYPDYLIVPAFRPFSLAGSYADADGVRWVVEKSGASDDVTSQVQQHSYSSTLTANEVKAAPVLYVGNARTPSFSMYAYNTYYRDARDYTRIMSDTVCAHSFVSDHSYKMAWGSINSGYLYGSGIVSSQAYGDGHVVSVSQKFPKPMAPLYVEDLFLKCKTEHTDGVALSGNARLTITLRGLTSGRVLATLQAGAANLEYLGEVQTATTSTGFVRYGCITFTQRNSAGQRVPFVIDEPFELTLDGLDQQGVDIGFDGNVIADYDRNDFADHPTQLSVRYSDITRQHAYSDVVLQVSFTSGFEGIDVATVLQGRRSDGTQVVVEDCNVVIVSSDGNSCVNQSEFGENLPGAYVNTQLPWQQPDGTSGYQIATGTVSWIRSVKATPMDGLRQTYCVSVMASALPTGLEQRSAELYLEGRCGVRSAVPIIVVQSRTGTSIEETSHSAPADAGAMFDLQGRPLQPHEKGLRVMRGRIIFQK